MGQYLNSNDVRYGNEYAFLNFIIQRFGKSQRIDDRVFVNAVKEAWNPAKADKDEPWPTEDMIAGVRSVMSGFTERELSCAILYGQGYTLEEIGDAHNITRERVRQILTTAERRCSQWSRRARLAAGLDALIKACGASPKAKETDFIDSLGYSEEVQNILRKNGFLTVESIMEKPRESYQIVECLGTSDLNENRFYGAVQAHFTRNISDNNAFFRVVSDRAANKKDIPVNWLNLPSRIVNTLMRNGYRFAGDLEKIPCEDILRLRGIGECNYFYIFSVLDNLGLYSSNWSDAALESAGLSSEKWIITRKENQW